jgi:hypothetical protein
VAKEQRHVLKESKCWERIVSWTIAIINSGSNDLQESFLIVDGASDADPAVDLRCQAGDQTEALDMMETLKFGLHAQGAWFKLFLHPSCFKKSTENALNPCLSPEVLIRTFRVPGNHWTTLYVHNLGWFSCLDMLSALFLLSWDPWLFCK